MEMKAAGADQPVTAAEPRRRFVASLLYGRNVDRTAKTRARLGLAVLIFVLGYAIIGARLVMFAAAPEGHGSRRAIAQDAVATARPDVLDRNGEILATDVRAPSLYAEPHRIIDVDEAVELLTAMLPDLHTADVREPPSSKRPSASLQGEITPEKRLTVHHLALPGLRFLT